MKSLVIAMVLAGTGFALPLAAQQHQASDTPHAAGAMMPAMAAHMHAMDSLGTRLDSAVARMNRATGEAKTPAMQSVIRELVAGHQAMHAHMREMASHHRAAESTPMAPMQHHMPAAPRPDSTARPRR